MVGFAIRFVMGGAERKKAADAAEAAKLKKKPEFKDMFQPKASPEDTHSQTDMLRGKFGNELPAGKKNNDHFFSQRPETTDRTSTRSETSDRTSTRSGTSDRSSTRSETDRSSLTRQRTSDRSSPTREETDGRFDRERTASRAPSARSGDGRDSQDREVPDERAYDRSAPVDGKQEGDGKQKPRESKKTLRQSMKDGSKGLLKDYVEYKTYNAGQDVDNEMNAVTGKVGGAVEKMLGGNGGGDGGGGGGNAMYPPSGMMRGDSKSGDKNVSKPSVHAGRAGRVESVRPKEPETRREVSQKTRDTLKRNLDSYLEKENKLPSASNRGSFTSELSRGSERAFKRRLGEMNGMPIESVA